MFPDQSVYTAYTFAPIFCFGIGVIEVRVKEREFIGCIVLFGAEEYGITMGTAEVDSIQYETGDLLPFGEGIYIAKT